MASVPVSSPPSVAARSAISRRQVEWCALLLLLFLLVWKGVIPGWKILNTDFPNYYVVARLIREHYCLDRIYDWIWFQRTADHFEVGHQLAGFLGLTPFSAFPVVPLSWLSVLAAKRLWIVCNLALLAGSIELLSRQAGISRLRAWIIALCAVVPLRTSFLFGQMHILVLALLVVAYVSHMRRWQIASGVCIGFAAALKIYPAFFCIYFLVKKRWTALATAVGCIGISLLLSYAVAGKAATTAYLFEQLPRLLQGESQNPFLPSLTSSSGPFHRLFLFEPELNPHPLISSPLLYALSYPLWQALFAGIVLVRLRLSFRADGREALEWSMFLCLLMFLSSAPSSYQFVVLIAAAVPTISVLAEQRERKTAAAYLLLYFLACNVRVIHLNSPRVGVVTLFLDLTLWSGIALIILYCVLLEPPGYENRSSGRFFLTPAVKTAAVVVIVWMIGSYSAWSHFKKMPRSQGYLTDAGDGAYLRTRPFNAGNDVLYVAMLQEGYRIRGVHMPLGDIYPDSDQLSFTAGLRDKDIWIEQASAKVSRVFRFVSRQGTQTSCEIDDAEEPVLSNDESRLAFLREERGHGSLWMVNVVDCAVRTNGEAQRITPSGLDVRTIAVGPDGSFLISAVYEDRERIFSVSPGLAPQVMAQDEAPLDSPALSPDGRLLVMRKLISHRWQLASLDLSSHAWRQLTSGDCNAYSPAWKDNETLLYATDCMRGMGLTTLASLSVYR